MLDFASSDMLFCYVLNLSLICVVCVAVTSLFLGIIIVYISVSYGLLCKQIDNWRAILSEM